MDESATATDLGETCNGCGMSSIGSPRPWNCNVCGYFDLCEGCYIRMDVDKFPPSHSEDHVMSAVVISSRENCGVCGLDRSWTRQTWSFEVCPDFFLCEDCFQGLDVHQLPPLDSKLMSVTETVAECDSCNSKPILTQRWHCKVCPDFDLCDVCYEDMDVNHFNTVGHPMCAIAFNNRGFLGQDWIEPLFKKPPDIRWSFRVTTDNVYNGFRWRKRQVSRTYTKDQGDDMPPRPIVQANVIESATSSDTNLDVVCPMLVEGCEGLDAKLVASGSSSTTHDRNFPCWTTEHKVFLSHAGPQKDFVEQLHEDLNRVHQFVFFDKHEECLPKGENFPELILQAAMQCELAVVVMSEDYFTRKWPMIELAAFVESQKTRPSLKILPLFYKLSVEEFKEDKRQKFWLESWKALAQKDRRIDIQQWREALKVIPPLNGISYDINKGEVVYRREIVQAVCRSVTPYIRADDSHVQGKVRMSKVIQEELGISNNVVVTTVPTTPRIVGMYGMGGTGKTTLCNLVRDDLFQAFDGKVCHVELGSKRPLKLQREVLQQLTGLHKDSFKGLAMTTLQGFALLKERVPRHKVFLVVDNVWDTPKSLAEARDYLSVPFREGSVVLVTARTIHILEKLPIDRQSCFEVPELQEEEARTLFAHYAGCNMAKLSEVEKQQMKSFVEKCHFTTGSIARQYHPLALRVLGARVGANASNWKDIVIDFKHVDHERNHPIFSILRSSYDALSDRHRSMFVDTVLSFNFGFWSHGVLYKPRSVASLNELIDYLYDEDSAFVAEFLGVLQTKALVEVADGNFHIHDLYCEFVKKEVECEHNRKCRLYSKGDGRVFQRGWLKMMALDTKLTSLAKENLCLCSEAKILTIERCENLTELDIRGMNNLLILQIICVQSGKLTKIRVEDVDTLVSLKWASQTLIEFPRLAGLKSLKNLDLHVNSGFRDFGAQPPDFRDCTNLERLALTSNFSWNRLEDLQIGKLEIEELAGLEGLSLLRVLNLNGFSTLKEIPHLSCFPFLRDLILRDCFLITGFPGLAELTSLETFTLSDCPGIKVLPNMGKCTKLARLEVSDMWKIPGFEHLSELVYLSWMKSKLKGLPNLNRLRKLKILRLRNSEALENLENIGELPALQELNVQGCRNLAKLPDLRGSQLTVLDVCGTSVNEIPGVDHYTQLQRLMCSNTNLFGLPDLSNLHNLRELHMQSCSSLESLSNIGHLPALESMDVSSCKNLKKLPDFRGSHLKTLDIRDTSVCQIPGVDHCLQIEVIYCSRTNLTGLPDLSNLVNLRELFMRDCSALQELDNIGKLPALEVLDISGCRNLVELPDLSNLLNLRELFMRGCSALQKLDNIGKLPTLEVLDISKCPNLVALPDLSYSRCLEELDLSNSPLVDPNQVKLFGCQTINKA